MNSNELLWWGPPIATGSTPSNDMHGVGYGHEVDTGVGPSGHVHGRGLILGVRIRLS
jgi:hypothetical protein